MERKALLTSVFDVLKKDCEIKLEDYFVDDCKIYYNVANRQNNLFSTKNNIHELRVHLVVVKYVFSILFNEYKVNVQNIVCENDNAAVEWELSGMLPDETQITCKVASFFSFKNEKILTETQYWEDYFAFDTLISKFQLEKPIGEFIQSLMEGQS